MTCKLILINRGLVSMGAVGASAPMLFPLMHLLKQILVTKIAHSKNPSTHAFNFLTRPLINNVICFFYSFIFSSFLFNFPIFFACTFCSEFKLLSLFGVASSNRFSSLSSFPSQSLQILEFYNRQDCAIILLNSTKIFCKGLSATSVVPSRHPHD